MALSDDQRALLRLLAQREEGYDDIAALMGLSVDEVRARVRGALEELNAGAPAAGPVPGLGSSSSRDDAAGEEPSPAPPAEEAPPSPAPRRAPAKPSASQSHGGKRGPSLPRSRRRLAELVGGALVVLLLILFATGAIDIGGDSDSDGGNGGGTGASEVAANSGRVTQAVLSPVDGGDASGRALFGRVGKNPVLQVEAEGLEPTAAGESYAIWLYRSPKLALRVGAVRVGKSGGLAAQLPIPVELLAFLANGAFDQIRISLTGDAAYKAEVALAKRQKRLPGYTGETVLEGPITGSSLKAQ